MLDMLEEARVNIVRSIKFTSKIMTQMRSKILSVMQKCYTHVPKANKIPSKK